MKNVKATLSVEDQKKILGGEIILEVDNERATGMLTFANQLVAANWERLPPKTKVLFVRVEEP
jgi:hypothetical protein